MLKAIRLVSLTLLLARQAAAAPNPVRPQQRQRSAQNKAVPGEGKPQTKALKVNDAIYLAFGFGNTFMVTTPDGNVIIDTSSPEPAKRHLKLLKAVSGAPVKYIILTHAHGDHTGGLPLWKEPGTKIIAQEQNIEFMNYRARLAAFFAVRDAAQFSMKAKPVGPWAGNYGGKIDATTFFDDKYDFTLGNLTFELIHTPGETLDHLTVWLPKYKAAFVGDNFYQSFPNIYSLRGTKPRWALDYVESLNKVLALKPDIVLPSHGPPIRGNAEITKQLTRYRDAILYVHDAVVNGMNAGKDVFTLMRDVKLPPALEVGEAYGKLSWSIRGIYDGYAGYFDLNPATMYETPASAVDADLVKLAGGPEGIVKLALAKTASGRHVEALHLTDIVLTAEPANRPALEARLRALRALRSASKNSNESGWLDYFVGVTESKLASSR